MNLAGGKRGEGEKILSFLMKVRSKKFLITYEYKYIKYFVLGENVQKIGLRSVIQ